MKRIIGVGMIICLLVSILAVPAFATGTDNKVLRAANYSYANATLDISAGKANVKGLMQGIPGITTKITVHLYL